jgi:hypothetical protein
MILFSIINNLGDFIRMAAQSRKIGPARARALEARFIGMRFRSMSLPELPRLPQRVTEMLLPETETLQLQGAPVPAPVHGYVLRRRDTAGARPLLSRG